MKERLAGALIWTVKDRTWKIDVLEKTELCNNK